MHRVTSEPVSKGAQAPNHSQSRQPPGPVLRYSGECGTEKILGIPVGGGAFPVAAKTLNKKVGGRGGGFEIDRTTLLKSRGRIIGCSPVSPGRN